jgi:hypothetical protein
MDARKVSLERVFASTERLEAPLFQRPYVWNQQKNWEPLWESVQAVADRHLAKQTVYPHFLGTVVLDQVQTGLGARHARQIIDGQQRLTTLQLLLAALRDYCAQTGAGEKFVASFQKLTINDDPLSESPDHLFKVWPTTGDQEDFRAVMSAKSLDKVRAAIRRDSDSLIPRGYIFFYEAMKAWLGESDSAARLTALYSAVLNDLNLVVIDLTDGDDPQEIFETLNAHGTPLLPADLVKNYLFHLARTQKLDTRKLYEKYWDVFDVQSFYWRKEVAQGRLFRPRLDLFLFHYLVLLKADQVPATQLFSIYRKFVQSSQERGAEKHMADFRSYAEVFASFETFPRGSRLGTFFYRLGELDTNTVYPLLLEVLKRYGKPEHAAELNRILGDLESFLVRRVICELGTKNYNQLFAALIKKLNATGDFSSAAIRSFLLAETSEHTLWPNDDEFRSSWLSILFYKRIKRNRARMILEAVNGAMHTGKTERVLLDDDLQIEHLLPQEWAEHWPLDESIPQEERERAEVARDEALHRVGNLTLLTDELNPSVSNGPWLAKRVKILEHSILNLNRPFASIDDWNEAGIQKRSAELFEYALTAWPYPEGAPPRPALSRASGKVSRASDEREEDAGECDRNFWLERVPSEFVKMADRFLAVVNTAMAMPQQLNYKGSYIGLTGGVSARNFIYFAPKKNFMSLFAEVRDRQKWNKRFAELGLETGNSGRYVWVMLRPGDDTRHSEQLSEFIVAGCSEYQGALKGLHDYDGFLSKISAAVLADPRTPAGVKHSYGSWKTCQNVRFHWKGTDVHVGVIVERDGTDSVDVYFCNYQRDEATAKAFRASETIIRRELGLVDAEMNLVDTRDAIDQSLGEVTTKDVGRLVSTASERVVKYLQVLKPLLGELF